MLNTNSGEDQSLSLLARLGAVGLVLLFGLTGVILLSVHHTSGSLLVLVALLIAMSLLQTDFATKNPTGRVCLQDLHDELEMRQAIFGETVVCTRAVPERSLTRRL
jgi:hypothetical protein